MELPNWNLISLSIFAWCQLDLDSDLFVFKITVLEDVGVVNISSITVKINFNYLWNFVCGKYTDPNLDERREGGQFFLLKFPLHYSWFSDFQSGIMGHWCSFAKYWSPGFIWEWGRFLKPVKNKQKTPVSSLSFFQVGIMFNYVLSHIVTYRHSR